MVAFLKDYFTRPLVGCEIGVAAGENAKSILTALPMKRLYLVDPYIPYYSDLGDLIPASTWLPKAQQALAAFRDKIVWLLEPSSEAVTKLPDTLDFVYIDGNHRYEHVKQDATSYYSKLRRGGVLGGHDFQLGYNGVVRAVYELLATLKTAELHTDKIDWWIIKK